MSPFEWYAQLVKPVWAPPAYLFGPVWTVLYVFIAGSFGFVFYQAVTKHMPRRVALPFALNLLFNLAFSPLQFGLRSNLLAMVDIVLVLVTLMWAIVAVYPRARWISFLQLPYLLWVAFATVLQLTVTYLNR
jgi:tryptophan-rich sensory protein